MTRLHREMLDRMKVDSKDPLSFARSVLQNEAAPFAERKWACAQLFPFCHPKLSSIEARLGGQSHESRLEVLRKLEEDD
jgi:hypothetical protein